jgi:hypothetical protein
MMRDPLALFSFFARDGLVWGEPSGSHQLRENLAMKKITFLAIMSASLMLSTAIVSAQTILSSTHAGRTLGPIAVTTPVAPGFFPFGGGLSDVVAANVDSEGQLKVIDWSTYEGSLVRNGDAIYAPQQEEGSLPTSISAVGLDSGHIVTAHVDGTGRLTIISWQIGCTSSAVCLVKSASVPNYATTEYPYSPQAVSVTALSSTQVVTAAVNYVNQLAVQVWNINPTTYLPTAAAPAQTYELVQAVTVAAINSFQVVTAAQNQDGTVELALFNVGRKTVDRVTTAGLGTSYVVSQVTLASDFFGDIFTASVKDGDGDLSIDYWTVSTSGSKEKLSRTASVKKGSGEHQIAAAWMSAIDFLFTDEGSTAPVTAMGDTSGNLDVDFWSTSKELSHNATNDAIGTISIVPLGAVFSVAGNRSVSYFATGDQSSITEDLEIKLWSD